MYKFQSFCGNDDLVYSVDAGICTSCFLIKYFQAYRVIAGLVTRQWCLLEICSKQDIINIVTDAHMETAKKGLVSHHYYLDQNHDLPCLIAHQFLLYLSHVLDIMLLNCDYSS